MKHLYSFFDRHQINLAALVVALLIVAAGMISHSSAIAGTAFGLTATASATADGPPLPAIAGTSAAIAAATPDRSGWREPVMVSTMAIEGLRVGNTWHPPRGIGLRLPNNDGISPAYTRPSR